MAPTSFSRGARPGSATGAAVANGATGAASPELEPLPGWRDAGVRVLLLGTLLLQLFVWSSLEGYNLADTIEYVDLANTFVHEGALQPDFTRMRPPAFPLVYAPLFLLWDALGIEDLRGIMLLARALQMGFGLLFVLATVRLGARLGGRTSGLVAGVLALANPVFLQFAVDPLPGIVGGALLAFGFEQLLLQQAPGGRGTWLRPVRGGLLLGLAAIVSYKVLPIAAVLGALLVLRDRWRRRAGWIGYALGFALVLALELLLDRVAYGEWGLSLRNYLVYNLTVAGVPILLRLGLKGAATSLFEWGGRYYGIDRQVDAGALEQRVAEHVPENWYLVHLGEFLVWPVLLLGALALYRCVRRPRWSSSILLLVSTAFLVVLSAKHSKSFRLFLPALPLIAAFSALGFGVLCGRSASAARRVLSFGLLVSVLVLGVAQLRREGLRQNGAFWQAIAWVDAAPRADPERPARFSTDYYYPTRFRHSPALLHVRLGFDPSRWPFAGVEVPQDHPSLRRGVLRQLEALDWILLTEDMFVSRPGLLRALNTAFVLEAAFFEDGHQSSRGPVCVFRRRTDADAGRALYELGRELDAQQIAARFGSEPVALGDTGFTWLGASLDELPGTGLGWLTFGLRATRTLERDVFLRLEAVDAEGHVWFRTEQRPLHGLLPRGAFRADTVAVDGALVRTPVADLRARDALHLAVTLFEPASADAPGFESARFDLGPLP